MIQMFTKKRKKGFTLIELIVVIAILGILMAIAVPRLGGFRNNALVASDEAFAKTLAQAVDMYNAANNTIITAGVFSGMDTELADMVDNDGVFESTTYGGTGSAPTLVYNADGNATVTNGTIVVWEP